MDVTNMSAAAAWNAGQQGRPSGARRGKLHCKLPTSCIVASPTAALPTATLPSPPPTWDSGATRRGRRSASQQGPMMRRLSASASSMLWLEPNMAQKVAPLRPTGSAGCVAGYLTCMGGGGRLGREME